MSTAEAAALVDLSEGESSAATLQKMSTAVGIVDLSAGESSSVAKLRNTIQAVRKCTKKKKKRRSADAIAADLAKTALLAAERHRARADGSETGGDPREAKARDKIKQRLLLHFEPETPFEKEAAAVAATKEQRRLARADGGGNGGDSKARALRRVAQARLRERELKAEAELVGGRSSAKVAIVGAGPVGLWLAVLLARKHSTLANGKDGQPVITRNSAAPTIHVFEARQPQGGGGGGGGGGDGEGGGSKAHGTRSIVLAITQQTQDLLNHQLIGATIGHCGTHAFAPTSRIGDIEKILLAEFQRYCAAGLGKVLYGAQVEDPDELHDEASGGYDAVFVASGRRNASDEWRKARGMETIVEGTAAAAILEFWGARHSSDGWSSVVASASRAISPAQIFVRPGSDGGRGWVWLVGLPAQLSEAIKLGMDAQRKGAGGKGGKPPQHTSLAAAMEAVLAAARSANGAASGGEAAVLPGETAAIDGLRTLDASVKAEGAKAGWTEASHWRSAGLLHTPEGARGPTILIGDAACGRPFWLGSTLNGHFADVTQLVQSTCWRAWDWLEDGDAPLRGYLDRMRTLRRCGANRPTVDFKRPSAEASAKLRWDATRQLSKSLGHTSGVGGALSADHAKSLAAAEMRNRARAVGVNRSEAGMVSRPMIELK